MILHLHIQAVSEEKGAIFDEVWNEELAQSKLEAEENEGEIEHPNILSLPINDDITLKIEFHPCYTYYFLNNIIIGDISGHFYLKYITYPLSGAFEICKAEIWRRVISLLLPLSAIRGQEKE